MTKTKTPKKSPAAEEKQPDTQDTFTIAADQRAVEVPASVGPPYGPATVSVGSGSSAYWANTPEVIEDPHPLAPGESVTVDQTVYITSAGTSNVTVSRTLPRAVNPGRVE